MSYYREQKKDDYERARMREFLGIEDQVYRLDQVNKRCDRIDERSSIWATDYAHKLTTLEAAIEDLKQQQRETMIRVDTILAIISKSVIDND
jgi:hypothetical protein